MSVRGGGCSLCFCVWTACLDEGDGDCYLAYLLPILFDLLFLVFVFVVVGACVFVVVVLLRRYNCCCRI